MAWLQTNPNGVYYIGFRFGGKKFKRSLKTRSQTQATARKLRLEETIQLIEAGRIDLPSVVDVPTFLLSDGKLVQKHSIPDFRIAELSKQFFADLPKNALELSTIKMMKIHDRHLRRILGNRFNVALLTYNDLQKYVNKRSKQPGNRGRTISGSTIKKEIATLRGMFAWAIRNQLIPENEFPSEGLRYPKATELPPFQTYESVLQQTSDLDPESDEAKNLWSTVFLNLDEVDELLDHIHQNRLHPFLYPMFAIAAHTGARRSEILRAEPGDVGNDVLTVRERKRKRGKHSTRRIPLSPRLKTALRDWLEIRPPSPFLICNDGNRWCPSERGQPISRDQANHHFSRAIKGSKFRYLRGWHTLRHSFCSCCAARGLDARVIDEWVGHSTESMRRRYRHLYPSMHTSSMEQLFR